MVAAVRLWGGVEGAFDEDAEGVAGGGQGGGGGLEAGEVHAGGEDEGVVAGLAEGVGEVFVDDGPGEAFVVEQSEEGVEEGGGVEGAFVAVAVVGVAAGGDEGEVVGAGPPVGDGDVGDCGGGGGGVVVAEEGGGEGFVAGDEGDVEGEPVVLEDDVHAVAGGEVDGVAEHDEVGAGADVAVEEDDDVRGGGHGVQAWVKPPDWRAQARA